jgi:hypothetical protein
MPASRRGSRKRMHRMRSSDQPWPSIAGTTRTEMKVPNRIAMSKRLSQKLLSHTTASLEPPLESRWAPEYEPSAHHAPRPMSGPNSKPRIDHHRMCASNGEVEGPRATARTEPRAHTAFPRPRRHYRASRTPPTIVRPHAFHLCSALHRKAIRQDRHQQSRVRDQ